jgi:predicted DNA-binding protein with PD1-like motif
MQSRELTIGRTFGVTFDHGDDFFDTLIAFCQSKDIRQGYIPMFLAGFEEAEIVGTSEKLEDPNAPVWSKVHLENVEAVGCGTIAYDAGNDHLLPHIHTSLGIKDHGATAHQPPPLRPCSVPRRDASHRGCRPDDAPTAKPQSLRRSLLDVRRIASVGHRRARSC